MRGSIWGTAAGYLSIILGVILTSVEFRNPLIISMWIVIPVLAGIMGYYNDPLQNLVDRIKWTTKHD